MLTEVEKFLKDPSCGLVSAPREGQLIMARRIAETMRTGGVAFIEAPVGTGKSYAYLVPAAISGQRTVVSTVKKNLQDQLFTKDIPAVKKATQSQFSFAILKGANNYFCASRASRLKSPAAKAAIAEWQFSLTDIVSDGDKASFPGGPPKFWPEISVDDCEGKRCPHYKECGYIRVTTAAREAQVVVTNHLVLAHSLVRGSDVFGDYKTLIIDEGHQFPDALRTAQTKELSRPALNNLYRRYEAAGGQMSDKPLVTAWRSLVKALPAGEALLLPADTEAPVQPLRDFMADMVRDIDGAVRERQREGEADPQLSADMRAFSAAARQLGMAADALAAPRDNYVNSATPADATGDRQVVSQPIYAGSAVRPTLQKIHAVILTSATLTTATATDEGSFTHIAIESGLADPGSAGATTLRCPSPFNYAKQAVLYTPKHLPSPTGDKAAWLQAVSGEIKRLVVASDGNTLVLFSSMSDLRGVRDELARLGLNYPVIAQEPGEAAVAEERYRYTENAVLLGSKSFFEGLNIEGDKLWSVIIPKLPFAPPTDPVLSVKRSKFIQRLRGEGVAESRAGMLAFERFNIPPMVLDVVQGGGRLIRTTTDRGVLAILDPRIWTGSGNKQPTVDQSGYEGYGAYVVKSLGFGRRTSKFHLVNTYFASLRKSTCPGSTS